MTPALDTAEGRRLLEKATPGPWSVEYSEIGDGPDRRLIAFVMGSDETYVVVDEDPAGDDEPSPDARLIVYAVNNLPALLSAAAALERERDEAVKAERERMAGQLGEGPHSGVTAPDGVDCYYFDTANGCIVIWHGKAYAVDNEGDVDFTKLATLREPSDG